MEQPGLHPLEQLRRRENWSYSDLANEIATVTGVRRPRDAWLDICTRKTKPNARTREVINQVLAKYRLLSEWADAREAHVAIDPVADVATTPAPIRSEPRKKRQRGLRVTNVVSSGSLPGRGAVPSPAAVDAFIDDYVRLCAKHGVTADPNGSATLAVHRADLAKRRYLSLPQLAEYLGWTLPKTRHWLTRNRSDIRRSREGNHVIVWRLDVDVVLDAHAADEARRHRSVDCRYAKRKRDEP